MGSVVLYLSIFFISSSFLNYSERFDKMFIEEKVKKIIYIVFVLSIPAFFAGIREGIGTDYNNYSNIFTAINTGVGNNPTEMGYTLLNYIVGKLGGDIQIVFFIMSFLTFLFVYLFLNHYQKSISISIGMLVFLIMFYNMSYNIVRQVLAIAISLYAMKYIDEKKPKLFIIFHALAMMFHAGTIVLLPMYILYNHFSNKRKLFRIIVYFVYFFALANYSNIVEFISVIILGTDKYLYLTRDTGGTLGIGALVQYAPQLIIGMTFYDDLIKKNKSFKLYFFLLVIGYLTGLLPAFGAPIVLRRVASYFTVANVWIVSYYYRYFKNKDNYFWIVPSMIIYMLFLWYVMYIIGGDAETVPYNTIFNF